MAADRSILFKPQTDLAIANAICHEIFRNDWVHATFVRDHVSFHEGKTNIGYGLEDKFAFKDEPKTITLACPRASFATSHRFTGIRSARS
jgi:nitrate reductase NapA